MRKIAMPLVFLTVACLLCSAAAAGQQSPIRDTTVKPDVIIWTPAEGFYEFSLRVSGPTCGEVADRFFAAGEPIFFEVAGLADGSYTYQIVGEPILSPVILKQIAEARKRGTSEQLFVDLCQAGEIACSPVQADGHFEVIQGRAVLPDLVEETNRRATGKTGISARNQTIAMSLCVGFDCPANPSYDDTTILLMENNTRIKFDDTSTISGFPNRDWSLVANSRSSGGANRFMLQDCGNSSQGGCSGNIVFAVEANAPSSALYVDDGGRIGVRTSTPSTEIHIIDGDTPTVRLAQSGSGGFAPQTWDVAGNETNFFIRDVTNGSTLPLRIRPGAPSSSIDISASGDVGFGTASPVSNGITIHGGSANEAIVKLCHNGSGCGSTTDGANLALNGSDLFYTNRENGDLQFFTNNQLKMTLDNTNNHTITGNLTVNGDLAATGAKPFITPDPNNDSRLIRYVAMEGPEAALFVRGSVQLVQGKGRIELPEHFTALAVEDTMTVSLTPRSGASLGLAAIDVTSEYIDVLELENGHGSYKVDYVVYAVRQGYKDYPVYLPKKGQQ